jgi:hypothetical protein
MFEEHTTSLQRVRDRIDISDIAEVKYWTEKFDCSEIELRRAVATVGPLSRDVGSYLAEEVTKRD